MSKGILIQMAEVNEVTPIAVVPSLHAAAEHILHLEKQLTYGAGLEESAEARFRENFTKATSSYSPDAAFDATFASGFGAFNYRLTVVEVRDA